jgi:hypothetical protein
MKRTIQNGLEGQTVLTSSGPEHIPLSNKPVRVGDGLCGPIKQISHAGQRD